MQITNTNDALRLIQRYYEGVFTLMETVGYLIQAAATCPPGELAPHIPADFLDRIRKDTATPPSNASEVVIISGVLGGPNFDYKAYDAEMRRTYFEGAVAWNLYFGTVSAN